MYSFINQFGGRTSPNPASGLQAIKNALGAGLTINQIRNAGTSQGFTWGPAAQNFLNTRPSDNFISRYGGDAERFNASGLTAVNRALADGFSPGEVDELGTSQGITFGPKARAFLDQAKARDQRESDLNRQLDSSIATTKALEAQYKSLDKNYSTQIQSLTSQINKLRNTTREPYAIGISDKLAGFTNQGGTPMGIRKKGTRRFNRDVMAEPNNLKISNLNI